MTDPNSALKQLVEKREELLTELNTLRVETTQRQELLLRLEGGIEALTIIGATLDETSKEGPTPEQETV